MCSSELRNGITLMDKTQDPLLTNPAITHPHVQSSLNTALKIKYGTSYLILTPPGKVYLVTFLATQLSAAWESRSTPRASHWEWTPWLRGCWVPEPSWCQDLHKQLHFLDTIVSQQLHYDVWRKWVCGNCTPIHSQSLHNITKCCCNHQNDSKHHPHACH